ATSARPEAVADRFVRIRFARHSVRARTLGRPSPREAREREVERAPEEMQRARLADELAAEALEHRPHGLQRAPERGGALAIVRMVARIRLEADRLGHLDRHRPDADRAAEALERRHHLRMEL